MHAPAGRNAEVELAVFGKHPAWNDFMDDLGVHTPRMADLRQLLLERGVRACVEGGRWDKLEPAQVIDGFAHELLWLVGNDIIVGRIWSSRDGKGRSAYPMIACAELRGLPVEQALAIARPILQNVQERCTLATTTTEVVDAVRFGLDALRHRAAGLESGQTGQQDGMHLPGLLAKQPELGPDGRGMHRVLYQMERELAPFVAAAGGPRSRGGERVSRHVRVPVGFDDPARAMAAWVATVRLRVEPWCPLMLVAPIGRRWIDVLAGDLAGPELFCLRASAALVPPVSEVPYTIDAGAVSRYDQLLAAASGSTAATADSERWATPTVAAPGRHSGRRVLAIAAILAILMVGSLWFLLRGSRPSTQPTPPPTPQPPATTTPPAAAPRTHVAPGAPPFLAAVLSTIIALGDSAAQPAAAQGTPPSPSTDDVLTLTRLTDSEAINAFWRAQKSELNSAYDAASRPAMLAHAQRIAEALRPLTPQSVAELPEAAGPSDAWAGLARRKQEQQLAQLFSAWESTLIDPADEAIADELSAVRSDLAAIRGSVVALARATAQARARLETGEVPHDLAARLEEDPLARDAEIRVVVSPLVERIRRVQAIERMREVSALVEAAGPAAQAGDNADPAAAPEPEVVIAAWRRLGSLARPGSTDTGPASARDGRVGAIWPATAAELATDERLADAVLAIARQLAARDPARSESLASEVSAERIRRVKRMLAAAEDEPALAAAAAAMARLKIDANDLEPRVRFNLLLHGLRRQLSGALPDDAAAAAARQFLTDAAALPGGTVFVADAASTVRSLEAVLSGAAPPDAAPPAAPAIGPAVTGQYTTRVEGDRLVFQGRAGGSSPLEFIRMEPPADSGLSAFYLSVTEVSLGAFMDLVRASGLNPADLLAVVDEQNDGRLGPRTWVWLVKDDGAELTTAAEWLTVLDVNQAVQYAPGGYPGRPSTNHPVNYISPYGAAILAAAVGCRLPTPEEWSFAAKLPAGDAAVVADAAQNLRDQAWVRHDAHVRQMISAGKNLYAADAGSIGPVGGASAPTDDGILWLATVQSGGGSGLRHMVGNVAEWLLQKPASPTPTTMAPAEVERFVSENRERFWVAGGSALSDATGPAIRPRPIDVADAAAGYADVGFRLAFSAAAPAPRSKTLTERLRTVANDAPYLQARTR